MNAEDFSGNESFIYLNVITTTTPTQIIAILPSKLTNCFKKDQLNMRHFKILITHWRIVLGTATKYERMIRPKHLKLDDLLVKLNCTIDVCEKVVCNGRSRIFINAVYYTKKDTKVLIE